MEYADVNGEIAKEPAVPNAPPTTATPPPSTAALMSVLAPPPAILVGVETGDLTLNTPLPLFLSSFVRDAAPAPAPETTPSIAEGGVVCPEASSIEADFSS